MSLSTARLPASQNSAPIHEFACIYTHDIKRKNQKRWQDGFLRFHTFNKRVIVYDIPRSFIGETFLKGQDGLEDGDELTLDRGVMIQVCEPKGTVMQIREEILDKVAARAGKVEGGHASLNITPSSHTPRTPQNEKISPNTARNQVSSNSSGLSAHSPLAQLRPKPLNAILGTGRGLLGRASLPKVSPYQENHRQFEDYDRPAKRQRISNREEMIGMSKVSTTAKRQLESNNTIVRRQAQEESTIVAELDKPHASMPKSRLTKATQHFVGMTSADSSTVQTPTSPTSHVESWRSDKERIVKSPVIDLTGTNSDSPRHERHLKKAQAATQEQGGDWEGHTLAKLSKVQSSRKIRHSASADKPISKLRSAVAKKKPLMYQSLMKERRQVNVEQRRPRTSSLSSDTVTSECAHANSSGDDFEDESFAEALVDLGTIITDTADERHSVMTKPQLLETRDEGIEDLRVEPIENRANTTDRRHDGHSSIESDGFESWDDIMKNKTTNQALLEDDIVKKTPQKAAVQPEICSPGTTQKATLSSPSTITSTQEVRKAPHNDIEDQSERTIPEMHSKEAKAEKPDPEFGLVVNNESIAEIESAALGGEDSLLASPVIVEKPLPVIAEQVPVTSRSDFLSKRPIEQTNQPTLVGPTKNFVLPIQRRTSPLKKSLTDTTTLRPQPPIVGLQRSNTGDFATKSAPISLPQPLKPTDSDMGPWSKYAYDLFGFEGGEGWSINDSSSRVDPATEPPELVERQKELVRKAKKQCRGMGGSTKSNIVYDDDYDYVESTYS